jgi:hypothetical protein
MLPPIAKEEKPARVTKEDRRRARLGDGAHLAQGEDEDEGELEVLETWELEAGADTRPLFSSTSAIFVTVSAALCSSLPRVDRCTTP